MTMSYTGSRKRTWRRRSSAWHPLCQTIEGGNVLPKEEWNL